MCVRHLWVQVSDAGREKAEKAAAPSASVCLVRDMTEEALHWDSSNTARFTGASISFMTFTGQHIF